MKELIEVTPNKLYVLFYDQGIDDYDLRECAQQVYEHLPKESELLIMPKYYDLQEVDADELIELRNAIDRVLESYKNNS